MDRKTVMNNHMQIYSNENRYKSRRRNRMIAIGHREIRRELNLERGGRESDCLPPRERGGREPNRLPPPERGGREPNRLPARSKFANRR